MDSSIDVNATNAEVQRTLREAELAYLKLKKIGW